LKTTNSGRDIGQSAKDPSYRFDNLFHGKSATVDVFSANVKDVVLSALDGFNGWFQPSCPLHCLFSACIAFSRLALLHWTFHTDRKFPCYSPYGLLLSALNCSY
jgi:hypothetical protein